jgi:hypothetical protein
MKKEKEINFGGFPNIIKVNNSQLKIQLSIKAKKNKNKNKDNKFLSFKKLFSQ